MIGGRIIISETIQNFFVKRNDKQLCNYYYADGIVEKKFAYCKKLSDARLRLELLGYTLPKIKMMYFDFVKEMQRFNEEILLDYETLFEILISIDINEVFLNKDYYEGEYDLGEYISQYIIKDKQFAQYKEYFDSDTCMFLENIDPYILLRILIENPRNLNLNLIWRYGDVLDGGWVIEETLYEELTTSEKYLLVTEGTSDSFILKKAFEIVYPEINDFFYFVDMEENYPFTGTGNLHKFCQGLSRINILNKVLFIYDNDLEGNIKYKVSNDLGLPKNTGIMTLPSLQVFAEFNTIGPFGESICDINGKAVSIECFLDLNYNNTKKTAIRWLSYVNDYDSYQGALINKDDYIRVFKKACSQEGYDFSKIRFLLDEIINKCLSLSDV